MHERLLGQAALPARVRVLGLVLRPYSLGHELWLWREGNPLAAGGLVRPQDLVEAVWICAQGFVECRRLHCDRLLGLKLRIWRWRVRGFDFGRELAAFREYQQAGSLEFRLSEMPRAGQGASPRAPGSPFLLRLHLFLTTHFRLTDEQAWDYPLGLAKMKWEGFWEQEGGLAVFNAHDAEHERFVLEEEAKAQKEAPCRA